MSIKTWISLAKQTFNKWSEHQAPRLGASVAFYSLLSFAPLLVLIAAMTALVFDRHTTQNALMEQARQMIGDRGADTVKSLLENAQKPSSGIFASAVAFVTLLFGASGVFSELRDALNTIWDAEPKQESGWRGMLKQKLFSFGMVLSVGFLLLVSLILSAGLAVIGKFFGQLVPMPVPILEGINFLVSLVVITFLFALLFKFVPARTISWRDVRVGAILTALLFTVGKFLLGLYLGKAGVGSAYGAAGSLVAVIVWVYYSAQIFFFGAEFTRVYADYDTGDARHLESTALQAPKPINEFPVTSTLFRVPALDHRRQAVSNPAASEPTPNANTNPQLLLGPAPRSRRRVAKVGRSLLVALCVGFLFGRVSRQLTSSTARH
ncbi:MAG TPA: YihY/virulence factor BrkB family protein [Bryobacteraceae bacterium]|jgi:membrane protein|nr:YihY/virulence factor BrkB family protein [Bryobacteraceae bacterium]